jgi:hypothetical protein
MCGRTDWSEFEFIEEPETEEEEEAIDVTEEFAIPVLIPTEAEVE